MCGMNDKIQCLCKISKKVLIISISVKQNLESIDLLFRKISFFLFTSMF
jgi:hypothetical protein